MRARRLHPGDSRAFGRALLMRRAHDYEERASARGVCDVIDIAFLLSVLIAPKHRAKTPLSDVFLCSVLVRF